MLDSSYTTSTLTSDEVDYLENVISNNYSSQEYNYYCEPDFKGQLMKYFPEPIISNFNNNNDHDLNLIKMSDLVQISDLNSNKCIKFHQKYFYISYNNDMLIIILDSDELCSNDSFSSPSSNESYSFDKIKEKKNEPKEKRIICSIKNLNFINNLLIYYIIIIIK